jgi:hypothetical protein
VLREIFVERGKPKKKQLICRNKDKREMVRQKRVRRCRRGLEYKFKDKHFFDILFY